MRDINVVVLAMTLPMLAQAQPLSNVSNRTTESVSRAYRAFQDEPVANWREVNDTVRRIGGWKVYARERLPAETSVTSQETEPAAAGVQK